MYGDELKDRRQDKGDNGPPEDFIVALQEYVVMYLRGVEQFLFETVLLRADPPFSCRTNR